MRADNREQIMKGIPLLTLLLIINNIYLNALAGGLDVFHLGLFRFGGIPRDYITTHSHLIRNLKLDLLGVSCLTLVLVIIIWKKRLCNRWLATAISVLWLVMLLLPFSTIH